MKKSYTRITPAEMDLIIKLAFGPRKMSATAIGEQLGVHHSNICGVIRAYTLVGNDDIEDIVDKLASKKITMNAVEWAFDYYGKAIPEDLQARVEAKRRGVVAFPEEETSEQKKTGDDNLLVLCERLNMLGQAISECLTENTAAALARMATDAINSNADLLLSEMKKQTEILQRIEYNTKKLSKQQNQR